MKKLLDELKFISTSIERANAELVICDNPTITIATLFEMERVVSKSEVYIQFIKNHLTKLAPSFAKLTTYSLSSPHEVALHQTLVYELNTTLRKVPILSERIQTLRTNHAANIRHFEDMRAN